MNFKKVIQDIQELITRHKQVKGFGIGDIKQLSYYITQNKLADGSIEENTIEQGKSPRFPLVYVIPQPYTRDRRTITYTFNILVCDILSRDFSNEVDVWSDTLQIAEDIVAQFGYSVEISQGNYYDRYEIETPITITPFSESYDDYVNGWNLSLSLLVDEPINRCEAAFETFTDYILQEDEGIVLTENNNKLEQE